MKEVWVNCFISYFPSFISSHFINKFLLIKVPQFDFKIWERRLFFSHLTTSISITTVNHVVYCKWCLDLKNPLGTKLHLIKLARVQRWLRKFPFHSLRKLTRELFCMLVSCRYAGCWMCREKGRTTKAGAGWSYATMWEALPRARHRGSPPSPCCRPFPWGRSQAPGLAQLPYLERKGGNAWGRACAS